MSLKTRKATDPRRVAVLIVMSDGSAGLHMPPWRHARLVRDDQLRCSHQHRPARSGSSSSTRVRHWIFRENLSHHRSGLCEARMVTLCFFQPARASRLKAIVRKQTAEGTRPEARAASPVLENRAAIDRFVLPSVPALLPCQQCRSLVLHRHRSLWKLTELRPDQCRDRS
jgi:hypothetical protein